MGAFTDGFNIGFESGMFNRMFCNIGSFCGLIDPDYGIFTDSFNCIPMPQACSSVFTPDTAPQLSFNNSSFATPTFNYNNAYNQMAFNWDNINLTMGDTYTRSYSGNASFYSGNAGTSVNRRVDTKCNLTAAQLNKSLKGVLAGKGQKFLDAEAKYGVNAAFMVAICNIESGNGSSAAARQRNNVAGILPHGAKSFSSADACIDYLGNLLANSKHYFKQGKKTIAAIGPTYCGPNWAPAVSKCMDLVLAKA